MYTGSFLIWIVFGLIQEFYVGHVDAQKRNLVHWNSVHNPRRSNSATFRFPQRQDRQHNALSPFSKHRQRFRSPGNVRLNHKQGPQFSGEDLSKAPQNSMFKFPKRDNLEPRKPIASFTRRNAPISDSHHKMKAERKQPQIQAFSGMSKGKGINQISKPKFSFMSTLHRVKSPFQTQPKLHTNQDKTERGTQSVKKELSHRSSRIKDIRRKSQVKSFQKFPESTKQIRVQQSAPSFRFPNLPTLANFQQSTFRRTTDTKNKPVKGIPWQPNRNILDRSQVKQVNTNSLSTVSKGLNQVQRSPPNQHIKRIHKSPDNHISPHQKMKAFAHLTNMNGVAISHQKHKPSQRSSIFQSKALQTLSSGGIPNLPSGERYSGFKPNRNVSPAHLYNAVESKEFLPFDLRRRHKQHSFIPRKVSTVKTLKKTKVSKSIEAQVLTPKHSTGHIVTNQAIQEKGQRSKAVSMTTLNPKELSNRNRISKISKSKPLIEKKKVKATKRKTPTKKVIKINTKQKKMKIVQPRVKQNIKKSVQKNTEKKSEYNDSTTSVPKTTTPKETTEKPEPPDSGEVTQGGKSSPLDDDFLMPNQNPMWDFDYDFGGFSGSQEMDYFSGERASSACFCMPLCRGGYRFAGFCGMSSSEFQRHRMSKCCTYRQGGSSHQRRPFFID